MSWTESYASLAVNAVLIFAADSVGFGVVEVGFVCALVNADFAAYTTFLVSFNYVFWLDVGFHF
jgi:hypothetical protein